MKVIISAILILKVAIMIKVAVGVIVAWDHHQIEIWIGGTILPTIIIRRNSNSGGRNRSKDIRVVRHRLSDIIRMATERIVVIVEVAVVAVETIETMKVIIPVAMIITGAVGIITFIVGTTTVTTVEALKVECSEATTTIWRHLLDHIIYRPKDMSVVCVIFLGIGFKCVQPKTIMNIIHVK